MRDKLARGAVALLVAVWLLNGHAALWGEFPSGSLLTQTSPSGPLQNRLILDWTGGLGPVRLLFYDSRWTDRDAGAARTVLGIATEFVVVGPVTLHGVFAEWWNPVSLSTSVFESGDASRLTLDAANPPTQRSGVSLSPLPPLLLSVIRHVNATAADVMVRTPAGTAAPIVEAAIGFTTTESSAEDDWFLAYSDRAAGAIGVDPILRLSGRLRLDPTAGATIDASFLGSFGASVSPGYRIRLAVVIDPLNGAAPIGDIFPDAAVSTTTLVTPFFRSSQGSIGSTGLFHSTRLEWHTGDAASVVGSLQFESCWRPEALLFPGPFSLRLLASPSLTAAVGMHLDQPVSFSWTAAVEVPTLSEPAPTLQGEMKLKWIVGPVGVEPHVRVVVWPETEQLLEAAVELSPRQRKGPATIDIAVESRISPTTTVGVEATLHADLPMPDAERTGRKAWVTIAGDWSQDSGWQLDGSAGWRVSW